jgi:hypothetical protein
LFSLKPTHGKKIKTLKKKKKKKKKKKQKNKTKQKKKPKNQPNKKNLPWVCSMLFHSQGPAKFKLCLSFA